MATYNGAGFLAEQLQSISDQTVTPIELIICDDGSTDATLQIAQAFATCAKFPVRLHVNRSRLGYVRNFRKAASLCSGQLVAFCDQDDWWLPNRLEVCATAFEDPELQLVYHNAWLVDGDRRRYGKLYNVDREQRALELEPIGPWNHSYGLVQIFRSSLRKFDDLWDQSLRHSGPADIVSHDEWYFFLAQAIGKAGFLDQALVEYRQHGSNLVSAKWVRPAVETRLLRRLAHDGSQDLRLARAAEARCSILRQMAHRRPEHAPRLGRIADHYQLLAERNRRRFRTYSAPEPSVRMRSLIRSWRQGDYSQWPWGFNKWSVLRDLWSGVALANKATQAPATPERAKHRDGGVEPLAD